LNFLGCIHAHALAEPSFCQHLVSRLPPLRFICVSALPGSSNDPQPVCTIVKEPRQECPSSPLASRSAASLLDYFSDPR
jgi:hypothetical protein